MRIQLKLSKIEIETPLFRRSIFRTQTDCLAADFIQIRWFVACSRL